MVIAERDSRTLKNRELLSKYLPEMAVEPITVAIEKYQFQLTITKTRHSKYGDYRCPHGNKGHRITINHDLNPYAFLVTLVHEIAHLVAWEQHHNDVSPHGKEWKFYFRELMIPFLRQEIFPENLLHSVVNYLKDPAASSCTDPSLLKALRQFDVKEDGVVLVEEIPENAVFRLVNGLTLKKGEKLRKRFKCKEVGTRRYYLVSPMAEAKIVVPENQGLLKKIKKVFHPPPPEPPKPKVKHATQLSLFNF